MSNSEAEFIAKMQAKYGGFAGPVAAPPGNNGTTMPGMGMTPNDMMRFTGDGPDNVTQPSKEVKGVPIHEDEMIVEEPLIKKLGGPAKTRAEIEGLVERKEKGFQEGTDDKTIGGSLGMDDNPLVGGISDTSNKIAAVPKSPAPPPKKIAAVRKNPDEPMGLSKNFDHLRTPPPTPLEVPEPPDLISSPPTQFEQAAKTGLEGLQDVASGESEVARLEREQAETALAGSQAAEDMVQRQELAQQGAAPEVAAAANARQNRQQRLERSGLQADLATGAAVRAESAFDRLTAIGMEGMFRDRDFVQNEKLVDAKIKNMEDMVDIDWAKVDLSEDDLKLRRDTLNEGMALDWAKYGLSQRDINSIINSRTAGEELALKQFGLDEQQVLATIGLNNDEMALKLREFGLQEQDINSVIAARTASTDLQLKEFNQRVEEVGVDQALREREVDWKINSGVFNTLIASGDFENASKLLGEKYGININLDQITDEKKREQAGNATADLLTRMDFLGQDALAPETAIDDVEIQAALKSGWEAISDEPWGSAAASKWATNTFNAAKLSMDPISSVIGAFSEDSLENMALAAGWENVDDFEFAGQTGADAVRLALTDAFGPLGGATVNDEGEMVFNQEGAIATLMRGPGGGEDPDASGTPKNTSTGIVANPTLEQREENLITFQERINQSQDITGDDIIDTFNSVGASALPHGADDYEDWVKDNNNPGGYVNLDGRAYKVISPAEGAKLISSREGEWRDNVTSKFLFVENLNGDTFYYVPKNDEWRNVNDPETDNPMSPTEFRALP